MLTLSSLIQSILSGVVEGINYSLYCVGLAFVFGIMKVINLSHGEFLVLGGYVAYWCLVKFGLDPLLSLLLAAALAGLTSLVSYRVFIQRIRTQPELNTLILTFGLGIFLANLFLQLWTADIRNIGVEFWEHPLAWGAFT